MGACLAEPIAAAYSRWFRSSKRRYGPALALSGEELSIARELLASVPCYPFAGYPIDWANSTRCSALRPSRSNRTGRSQL